MTHMQVILDQTILGDPQGRNIVFKYDVLEREVLKMERENTQLKELASRLLAALPEGNAGLVAEVEKVLGAEKAEYERLMAILDGETK